MSQAHVTEPKLYCQICGCDQEKCEAATTCPKCSGRRDRLRKEEQEFTEADDEPIPYSVTEKGWDMDADMVCTSCTDKDCPTCKL